MSDKTPDEARKIKEAASPAGAGARQRESEELRRKAVEPLTDEESRQLADNARLSAVTIYAIIRREGEEELSRPAQSLWWSGVAAGMAISSSLLSEAALHANLPETQGRHLIAAWGYTVGFILVVLSRLQLFTENTISVILPLLAAPSSAQVGRTARLWSIVLCANFVGTFAIALITVHLSPVPPEIVDAMIHLSAEATAPRGLQALLYGVPAGFFVAALVWILPSSKGFEIISILVITYVIAISGATHVIVGSVEIFLLILNGNIGAIDGMGGHLLPVLIGNIIGGSGLFAMLAYGQVHEEL